MVAKPYTLRAGVVYRIRYLRYQDASGEGPVALTAANNLRPRADILRMLLMVRMIARRNAPPSLVLAADRLQEHRVPVEIKKLLLAAGERAHIDGLCGDDTGLFRAWAA
jgi:hypothetical protein